MFSKHIEKITNSSTFVINKKVQELKQKGLHVINFGLGQANFSIPKHIKKAAIKAVKKGVTQYSPVAGILSLRKAIASYLSKFHINYDPEEVIVDSGSKHLLYSIMLAVANPGDEIILQAPYWVSYYDQALLAGLKIKILKTNEKNNFQIEPKELEKAIGKKTRLFILNSPNNPSGTMYSEALLKKIADIIVKKDIYIVSDEIYAEYAFYNKHISIASINPKIKKKTIITGGLSKSHAIGGWRIGFAAAEKDVIYALQKVISNTTSCAPSICQEACVGAFENDKPQIRRNVAYCKRNADFVYKSLSKIPGIKCAKPLGAFYIFPNVSAFFGKKFGEETIKNSRDFCKLLLSKKLVAALPGSDFGVDENIRISLAIPFKDVREGCKRIADFIGNLH